MHRSNLFFIINLLIEIHFKYVFENYFISNLKSIECTVRIIFFLGIMAHPNHITTLPQSLHITEVGHKSWGAIAHNINLMSRHHILLQSFKIGRSLRLSVSQLDRNFFISLRLKSELKITTWSEKKCWSPLIKIS